MNVFLRRTLQSRAKARAEFLLTQSMSHDITDEAKHKAALLAASPKGIAVCFAAGVIKACSAKPEHRGRRKALVKFARTALFQLA